MKAIKTTQTHQLLKMFLRDISQKNKLNEALEEYLIDVKMFEGLEKINEIPFSSERKYSACVYIVKKIQI